MTHIVLYHGTISACTVTDANGTHTDISEIGQTKFFVNLVDDEGNDDGLWDGTSYDEAILIAETARLDFGISEPVRDCVVGGAK